MRKHTFESSNARVKAIGNKGIVKNTYDGWQKPCTIIFADGSKSDKHSPIIVDKFKLKSKPGKPGKTHTFESANAKMQELGNSIVESTYKSWRVPCTIIFSDGTESIKLSPCYVDERGKSKTRKCGQLPHTFEIANSIMNSLGNKIVESTYEGWKKPCTIIFADGTESDKHSPRGVYRSGYISKPEGSGPGPNTKFLYITNFILDGETVGLKIGIAADALIRCGTIERALHKGKLVIHKIFKFHLYEYCNDAENEIIKELTRAPKSVCKHFTDGKKEVYAVDQLKPAMKIIRKYKKEHKCFEYTD